MVCNPFSFINTLTLIYSFYAYQLTENDGKQYLYVAAGTLRVAGINPSMDRCQGPNQRQSNSY